MPDKIVLDGDISLKTNIDGETTLDSSIDGQVGVFQDLGIKNYAELANKPRINGVELVGNRTFEDLGEETITNTEIMDIVRQQYSIVFGGGTNA